MKIKLVTIGEPKGEYKELFNEYIKRAGGFAQIEVVHIKEGKGDEKKVLQAIEKTFVVLFDEKGRQFTSREFAQFLEKKEVEAVGTLSLLIGGPDGHTEAVRTVGQQSISLSNLTFPHDLAMLVASEAIYRALSIKAGHPYHRD